MLLRWIVNNYLRQAAEEKVREVVGDAFGKRSQAGAGSGRPSTGDATVDPGPAEASPITSAEENELVPCEVVFLFASSLESGGLVDKLKDAETSRHAHGVEHAGKLGGREVAIVEAGIGPKAAGRATAEAIKFYQPKWLVSAGFAAALHEDLRRGHVLMADSVANLDGQQLAVGLKLDEKSLSATRGLHVGRLLSVDDVIRRPEQRHLLHEQHQALACDMETFAVAKVCHDLGTRFLSVRIISDAVDDELPPEIERLLEQKSIAGKLGAVAGAMLKNFSAAKDLWRLREDALKASDRLAKFLAGMMSQLEH